MSGINPGPAVTTTANTEAALGGGGTTVLTNSNVNVIPVGPPSGDTTGATDYVAIIAAYNQALAQGAGTVQFQSGTYYISAALPLTSNIWYQGVPGSFELGPPGVYIGGTLLKPSTNYAFDCFDCNSSDRGSDYANYTVLWTTVQKNVGIRHIMMQNFAYGVKVGGKYNGGASDFFFENLTALNCSQWGFWFENCILGFQNKLTAYGCGVGHIMHKTSTLLWNFGNYTTIRNFCQGNFAGGQSTITTQGIVFMADVGSVMNFTNSFDLQANGSGTSGPLTSTQAATMVNTSATIGVTDGTKFALNMPVYFSAGANGFITNKAYFVTSVSGNNIQVSATWGGSAQAATGNSAVNVQTCGFPGIAAVANGGGSITSLTLRSMDIENGGGLLLAGCQYVDACMTHIPGNAAPYCDLICQNIGQDSRVEVHGQLGCVDLNTSSGVYFEGKTPTAHAQSTAGGPFYFTGVGVKIDASGNAGVSFSGVANNANGEPYDISYLAGSNVIAGRVAFAQPFAQLTNTSTLGNIYSVVTYSTAGVGTLNLPSVTSSWVGTPFFINNPQSSNLTVSAGSQSIIGLGVSGTSITVAPNSSALLVVQLNGSTAYFARYA